MRKKSIHRSYTRKTWERPMLICFKSEKDRAERVLVGCKYSFLLDGPSVSLTTCEAAEGPCATVCSESSMS